MSPGFTSYGAQNQLDRIIDRALRAEVVINSIDPRGLAILMQEADASQGYTPADAGLAGAQHAVAGASEFASSGVLAEVAAGTGGKFFHNNNDLVAGFRSLTSSAGSYILAFAPTDVKEDGKFHELQVKLKDKHSGFTVQARRGYFAGKRGLTDGEPDAKPPVVSAAEIQAEDQIRQALLSQGDVQQFPVELSAKLAGTQNNKRELDLIAHLDTRALRFHKEGENNVNSVTFVFAVFDEKDTLVDTEQRRARVNLSDAQLPQLYRGGMDVTMSFWLPPGSYRIRQIVADSDERHMTTISEAIQIATAGDLTQNHWVVTPSQIGGSTSETGLPVQSFSDLWSLGNTTRSPLQSAAGSKSNLDSQSPNNARKEYAKGYELFAAKDYAGAATHMTAAIKIDPNYVSAHTALGSIYMKLGQPGPARDEFSQAVGLDDHLPSSYLNLGSAQIALKDYASAETSVEKAAAIAPLDLQLATALAYLQLMNHHYDAVLTTTHQIHSEKHEGAALIHYYAAAAWQAKNNLPETRNELETLLREDPLSPVAAQSRQVLSQINATLSQPASPGVNGPATPGASRNPLEIERARKRLTAQTAKEEKQIREAETVANNCATCEVPGSPEKTVSQTGQVPVNGSSSKIDSDSDGTFAMHSMVDEVALLFAATDHGQPVQQV